METHTAPEYPLQLVCQMLALQDSSWISPFFTIGSLCTGQWRNTNIEHLNPMHNILNCGVIVDMHEWLNFGFICTMQTVNDCVYYISHMKVKSTTTNCFILHNKGGVFSLCSRCMHDLRSQISAH